MANHLGTEGQVKVASNTVAEVRSFSLDISADTVEDTVMGDTWKTHQVTQKEWSGSIECFWDETDTNGQMTMTEGASVTLNLYPEGSTSGDTYYTGTALITGIAFKEAHNGLGEATFQFKGTGALSKTTV